jgi:hypothetical protein
MENVENYLNLANGEMVAITNADGSITSMPKSVYDEIEAAKL